VAEQNKSSQPQGGAGVNVASVFLILAILSIVVAVIFWGLNLTRKYQLSSTDKKLTDVKEETSGLGDADQKAKAVAAVVDNINQLDASKNYWSSFLTELANQTTKNVQLTQLALDEQNNLVVSGATTSYEALAKYMVALRSSERFSEVILTGASYTPEGGANPVAFNIRATTGGSALSK
jgi:Tfp pilus assembly protein PilN